MSQKEKMKLLKKESPELLELIQDFKAKVKHTTLFSLYSKLEGTVCPDLPQQHSLCLCLDHVCSFPSWRMSCSLLYRWSRMEGSHQEKWVHSRKLIFTSAVVSFFHPHWSRRIKQRLCGTSEIVSFKAALEMRWLNVALKCKQIFQSLKATMFNFWWIK